MRQALGTVRTWAARHHVVVGAPIMLVAAVVAAIDELNTRFIAVFADGGDALPLKIPLVLIGSLSALAAVTLTGYGQTVRWRAWTAATFFTAAYVLWLPTAILIVIAWPELRALGLVHDD